MADEAARLVAVLEADLKNFTKGMAQAQAIADQRFGAIEKRIKQNEAIFSTSFSKIGGLAASFLSVRAITAFVDSISDAAEKLQSLSERTGISVESLQKLDAAARNTGTNQAVLNEGLDKFAKALGLAAHGQGDLAKVMKDNGITASDDFVASLLNVADAVQAAKSRSEEYRITQAALGKGSQELVEFLRQGSGAIREQMDAFKGGISTQTVRDLADFSRSWNEVEISFENMAAGPLSKVLRGFSEFTHDIETGDWLERLQAVASFFSLGLVSPPAITATAKSLEKIKELEVQLSALEKQRAAEQGGGGPGIFGNMAGALDAQIAAKSAELNNLRNATLSHVTGQNLLSSAKPAGAAGEGDADAAAKEVARTLAALKAAQASLAQATSAANAEALRDTDAYYAEVRKGAQESSVAAITAANEKAKAEIAALDETKIGHEAYAKAIENINQTAAAEESAIFEKRRLDIGKIDQEELESKRAASERLVQIDEQRAAATARINESAAQSARDLVAAQDQLALEKAQGTPALFAVERKALDDEAQAQRNLILEREATEVASLARLREERFKSGADGISIWADYEQAVQALHGKTADELTAVDERSAAQRLQILEDENHARADAVHLADEARSGLEDIGVAAIKGFGSFKEAAARALEQVADLIVQLYIMKPLVESVLGPSGTKLGGGGGAGILSAIASIGSLLGFAGGGRPPVGRPSWVGENGRELFMPDVAGTIIPASKIPQAISRSGMMLNVTAPVTVSLDGANGDATILAYARKGAEAGAAAAIKTIKAQFPAMIADYTKRWG